MGPPACRVLTFFNIVTYAMFVVIFTQQSTLEHLLLEKFVGLLMLSIPVEHPPFSNYLWLKAYYCAIKSLFMYLRDCFYLHRYLLLKLSKD